MLRALAFLLLVLAVSATAAEAPPRAHDPLPQAAEPLRPLPFYYDLYTFRGDEGRTKIVAAFAVPVGRLENERDDWAVRYRFDVSLVLADTAVKTVFRTDDSVYVRLPRSVDRDHLLHTHVEVDAPPSGSTMQRVIMTDATEPGIGQLYTTPFPVPDYSGTRLMLSDIALGLPGAEAGWEREGAVLALLPTSRFPESSFDVYYEIYNLPPGHPYQTRVAIDRLDEAGRPVGGEDINLLFSGEVPFDAEDVLPELRHVQSSLDLGHYRLTVEVTDQRTGSTVEGSRTFEVRGWGPGATLVPALPRRGPGSNIARIPEHDSKR